ncbi:glycine C-acetyltransferase [Echinicola sediminis]
MQHHPIAHKVDRVIPWEGKEYLYFSGTAYLGMGAVPEFEQLILNGIQKYGPNHGASRFSNVQLEVYDKVEHLFTEKTGADHAALLSSGFMAGYLTQALLAEMAQEVWAAPDAHPAILPVGFVPDLDQSFQEFAEGCIRKSQSMKGRTIAILCNAVDTILPAVHDFTWINELCPDNSYYLLVDDSHAFGLLGEDIFGGYQKWKELPVNLIVAGSLGKALAVPAGVILGDAYFMGKVKNSAIFRGASPPAPGYCEAFLGAEALYSNQHARLREQMSYFFGLVEDIEGLSFDRGFPVLTFKEKGWAARLMQAGMLISSFSYPRPEDAPVDRIVLSAYHRKEDLERLAEILRSTNYTN